ncbi:MAG: porin [Boseongicola sp.]|nr:porin [Boseongicola sp.]
MKRTLLASSALVAMSGAAFADDNLQVKITGSAEMGIADGGSGDAMFHQDVDVTFKMEAATTAGLTFGTAVDLDENAGGVGADDGGVAVYVSGPFGKVTMGDVDGGFDFAMDEVNQGAGSIADNHTTHAGFNGNSGLDGNGNNDGQILQYHNSFGGLEVALSFEQEDGVAGTAEKPHVPNGDIIGAGVTGSFGGVKLGAGFQQHDNASIAGASVTASFGGITGRLNYSRLSNDAAANVTHLGVGATYVMDETAVNVNFGQHDNGSADNNTGFGIAAQYDLGGGAKIQFGYGNSEYGYGENAGTDKDTWSLGLAMGF